VYPGIDITLPAVNGKGYPNIDIVKIIGV